MDNIFTCEFCGLNGFSTKLENCGIEGDSLKFCEECAEYIKRVLLAVRRKVMTPERAAEKINHFGNGEFHVEAQKCDKCEEHKVVFWMGNDEPVIGLCMQCGGRPCSSSAGY